VDKKVSLKMSESKGIVDIRKIPIPDQISRVDEAIKEAENGIGTIILTSSHVVGTYALPKSLDKSIKCKISPTEVTGDWRIEITPKP
tara:strand:+ start:801 stop:1061 length:261 start_codon:yes stop_codon:yes gene_type:complete